MMMLDSGTVSSRSASRSTGILPTGQSLRNAAADSGSAKFTTTGANGVPASYSAISTFWQ